MDPPGQSGVQASPPKASLYTALPPGKNGRQVSTELGAPPAGKAEGLGGRKLCHYKKGHIVPAAKAAPILGSFFASVVVSKLLSVADATAAKCIVGASVPRR